MNIIYLNDVNLNLSSLKKTNEYEQERDGSIQSVIVLSKREASFIKSTVDFVIALSVLILSLGLILAWHTGRNMWLNAFLGRKIEFHVWKDDIEEQPYNKYVDLPNYLKDSNKVYFRKTVLGKIQNDPKENSHISDCENDSEYAESDDENWFEKEFGLEVSNPTPIVYKKDETNQNISKELSVISLMAIRNCLNQRHDLADIPEVEENTVVEGVDPSEWDNDTESNIFP